MTTLDYTGLRLVGALKMEHLTMLEFHVGVNEHGWAVVEGEAGENAVEQLQGAVAGQDQVILAQDESGAEQPLFAGIIRTASLITYGEYTRFRIELQSGTIQMDQVKRSRSFQDVKETYSQIAQKVASEYPDGAVIPTVGLDNPMGVPVIQYRETDWEFMKRMASWCGGVVVPETHYSYPRLWFGFPERAFTCTFPEDCYTTGISQRYYELGGPVAGYERSDFLYYDVCSSQSCDLGWYTVFKGQEFLIYEKWGKMERGELIFTYRLGKPGLGWGRKQYNDKISGMTILGEVLSTERETVRLKLDIDEGWNPGGPYPYTWRPETGNMMYCMPQVGTQVSLYFPNYDEQMAMAVNCVRTNGGSCTRMSDPSKRSFVTEHGKEMNLYPQEMSLLGGANGMVKLEDETGISISTDKKITVVALGPVSISGKVAVATALTGEIVLAKGSIVNRSVETSVVQSGKYDLRSVSKTCIKGKKYKEFEACNDGLKEASFDWLGLVFSVVGMIAACVTVTVLGLTGIGAFVVGGLVAGAVCGAFYSGREAIEAGLSGGDVSRAILCGALVGGVQGAVNGLVAFGVFSVGAFLAGTTIAGMGIGGIMACGGVSGGIISAINQMLFYGNIDSDLLVKDAIQSSIFSGLFYGIGSIRAFKIVDSDGGRYIGIGNRYTRNGFIFAKNNGSIGGVAVRGGNIIPSGVAYIPGKGIVFAKPEQTSVVQYGLQNIPHSNSYPQYQLPQSQELVVTQYKNGHEIINPLDNPKIAKDVIADPEAVYGYRPKPGSSLDQFDIDWSDAEEVSKARAARLEYLKKMEIKRAKLSNEIDKYLADGMDMKEIAEIKVEQRNLDRIKSYTERGDYENLEKLYNRNLKEYGQKEGPTAEQLLGKYGSYEKIIYSSVNVNQGMNLILGIDN